MNRLDHRIVTRLIARLGGPHYTVQIVWWRKDFMVSLRNFSLRRNLVLLFCNDVVATT